MSIEEMVTHLANLTFIIEFHEKAGTTKNPWILAEFNEVEAQLLEVLKEKHSETRQS